MDMNIGVAGKAREVISLNVGVAGKARKVVAGWVGVGGKARQFWPSKGIPSVIPNQEFTAHQTQEDVGSGWTTTVSYFGSTQALTDVLALVGYTNNGLGFYRLGQYLDDPGTFFVRMIKKSDSSLWAFPICSTNFHAFATNTLATFTTYAGTDPVFLSNANIGLSGRGPWADQQAYQVIHGLGAEVGKNVSAWGTFMDIVNVSTFGYLTVPSSTAVHEAVRDGRLTAS